MLTLRDYQQDMDIRARQALSRVQSVLIVSPCGSGKGSLVAHWLHGASKKGKTAIFLVHGRALVSDQSRRITKLGVPHGILMGGKRREHRHDVQVASIDTLHRMEFPPQADLIICDEADMTGSPTWKKAVERYPKAKIIGLTATPIRLDGQGLGRTGGGLFDEMIVGPSEIDLIQRGHLVRSRVFIGKTPVIPKECHTSDKKLAQVCDKSVIIGDIVEEWKKNASTLKTLAFGVDCAHAQHITDSFLAAGIPWAYVDAKTPDDERKRIWHDLNHTNLMGVSNVGIATVGFDEPIIQCLIMARFTTSLRLWKQMLGRGSRPYPGKKEFTVLDFVAGTSHHSPYGQFEDSVDWSLDGDAIRNNPNDVTGPKAAQCYGRPVMVGDVRKFPCGLYFRSGPRECPYCGYPLPLKTREIEVIAGELREMEAHPGLWLPPELEDGVVPVNVSARRSFVFQMIGVAKKRGMSPAWVKTRFREKFAAEVPVGWMSSMEAR